MGCFVVVEGLDGAGKTSTVHALHEYLESTGVSVHSECEPTRERLGEFVRDSLTTIPTLDDRTMALLFAADRIEHGKRIRRALEAGRDVVVCDRYYHSSYAYQEVDESWNRLVNRFAMKPDLAFYIDVEESVLALRYAQRAKAAGHTKDPADDVLKRARQVYDRMCNTGELIRIDGAQAQLAIVEQIVEHIITRRGVSNG